MGVNLRKVRQSFAVKRLLAVGFVHRTWAGGFSVNSTCQAHLAVSASYANLQTCFENSHASHVSWKKTLQMSFARCQKHTNQSAHNGLEVTLLPYLPSLPRSLIEQR